MKNFTVLAVLLCSLFSFSQNKPVLYGFDKIPQTLLLNPGAEASYKYHIGVPFASGLLADAGISSITISDIFRDDPVDINTKFRQAISKLDANDYISVNTQIEILSGGYKIDSKNYLTAGFYTELDAFFAMPKDVLTLGIEGNAAYLNKPFSFSQINIQSEVLGVFHVGLARKLNNRLIAGARVKLYSGSTSFFSTNNSGEFTTRLDEEGIYQNELTNVDFEVNSSGVYNENDALELTTSDIFWGSFFGGNFGAGLDLGFTFQMNDKLLFSGSILDVGFVSYDSEVLNGKVTGDYSFNGIHFVYDEINPNYWRELEDDFKARVPRSKNYESFTKMRPIKINASGRYSFGKSRNRPTCHHIDFNDFYDNSVGGQLFTVFRPTGPKFAFTAFYERKFSKYFNTKVTYTIDDFSSSNIGLGFSTKVWKLNMYATAGNIFKLTDLAKANTTSMQFGINFLVD